MSDLLTHKLTSLACPYFDANLHEVFLSEKQKQNTQKNITQKNSATCRRTPTCSARMKLILATFHG